MKEKIEIFVAYLGLYSSAFAFTVVFPFASEMVMSLGAASDRDRTGFWVGMIATSLMAGRAISSPFWGQKIDTWGRKSVTQIGLFCMIILQISFGLCTSVLAAVLIRLLLGLLSPLMISSKTLIAELWKENSSEAMIWVTITANVGSISGSFFGGLLSNPNESGLANLNFFDNYPYFLCTLVPSLVSLIAFVLGFFFLHETLAKMEKTSSVNNQNRGFKEIVLDPKVFPIIVVYSILGYCFTAFQELITLFAWANRSSGGLQYKSSEIGFLLGISSFSLLFVQRHLFLYFKNRFGVLRLCKYSHLCLPFITFLLPLTSFIKNENFLKLILTMIIFIWFFLDFVICTALFVFMNHAVPCHELGKLNGISLSLNCLVRTFAPVTIGTLFASTIKETTLPQPLNFSMGFYLISILEFLGWWYTCKIDKSNEEPHKGELLEIPLVDIVEE